MQSKGLSRPQFKSINSSSLSLLHSPTLTSIHNYWKNHRFDHKRLLLNHAKTPGFLAARGEEFNPGPETRLDHSELLCNKDLLKYKGDRESF